MRPATACRKAALSLAASSNSYPGSAREGAEWTIRNSHWNRDMVGVIQNICFRKKSPSQYLNWSGKSARKERGASAPRGVALEQRLARILQGCCPTGREAGAVYSWHDFRHAFAQATVGRGMRR